MKQCAENSWGVFISAMSILIEWEPKLSWLGERRRPVLSDACDGRPTPGKATKDRQVLGKQRPGF